MLKALTDEMNGKALVDILKCSEENTKEYAKKQCNASKCPSIVHNVANMLDYQSEYQYLYVLYRVAS